MANLNIRVDDALKSQAELVLSDLGLTMTAAVNVFLKQAIRCNGIPFALQADPFYSAENQRRLLIAKQRMEQKRGTVHELIKVADD